MFDAGGVYGVKEKIGELMIIRLMLNVHTVSSCCVMCVRKSVGEVFSEFSRTFEFREKDRVKLCWKVSGGNMKYIDG